MFPAPTVTGFVRRRVLPIALGVLGAVLAGCTPEANDRRSLGSVESPLELETFAATSVPGVAPLNLETGDQPSITSLERGDWPASTYTASYNTVSHPTSYSTIYRGTDANSRQRGGYPSQVSATDTTSDRGRIQQISEAAIYPFYAGLDLLAFPWRMFSQAPWDSGQSPTGPRVRAPRVGLDADPSSR